MEPFSTPETAVERTVRGECILLSRYDRKLASAREARKAKRKERRLTNRKEAAGMPLTGETEAGIAAILDEPDRILGVVLEVKHG